MKKQYIFADTIFTTYEKMLKGIISWYYERCEADEILLLSDAEILEDAKHMVDGFFGESEKITFINHTETKESFFESIVNLINEEKKMKS